MKKFVVLFLVSCAAFSQQKFTLNPLRNVPKGYFLKSADSLFYFEAQIQFEATSNYIKPYKDIDPDRSFQPGYLEKKLATIAKNPSDHTSYGDIANYYQSKGNREKASEYYQKALNTLKLSPSAKDSSVYYSQRGFYKFNLGQEATADMERALSINKNDSVAVTFYPMFLIQNQKYADARKLLSPLVNDKTYSAYAYSMSLMSDYYEKMSRLPENQKALLDSINAMDLSKLATFGPNAYAHDKSFRTTAEMVGLLYAMVKFGAALEHKNIIITDKNRDFLSSKERYFKSILSDKNSNAYGAYVSLGLIDFLQKKYDAALLNYQKAIQAFPVAKEGFRFNTAKVYDAIAVTYQRQKRYDQSIVALQKKLGLKSLDEDGRKTTLLNIAKLHLQMGNAERAGDYARDALAAKQSFDVNLMLSYLNFKAGANVLADRYLAKASTNLQAGEICPFMDYIITLYLSLEQYDRAEETYKSNISEKGMECEKCENLIKNYLTRK